MLLTPAIGPCARALYRSLVLSLSRCNSRPRPRSLTDRVRTGTLPFPGSTTLSYDFRHDTHLSLYLLFNCHIALKTPVLLLLLLLKKKISSTSETNKNYRPT